MDENESIRDSIASAFDEAEAEPVEQVEAPEPVEESEPEPLGGDQTAEEATGGKRETEQGIPPERVRDPKTGQFKRGKAAPAKAPAAAPAVRAAPVQGQQPAVPAVQPGAPAAAAGEAIQAPQSYKPGVRELAKRLPAEFRPLLEEANRIDGEVRQVMQQAAEARKFETAFRERVQPFEALFRSSGVDPLTGVGQLIQTAWVLNTGHPQQRAKALAHMVRNFLGADEQSIGLLAQELDAAPAPAQAQQPANPAAIAQQVEQQIMQRLGQQRAQQSQQRAQAEISAFSQTHEFMADPGVRALTGSILAAATQSMTLEQAYDQACWASPEVRAVLEQRRAAEAAKARAASTQQARRAAGSIRSQPTAGKPAKSNGNVRDDVAEAFAEVEGQ